MPARPWSGWRALVIAAARRPRLSGQACVSCLARAGRAILFGALVFNSAPAFAEFGAVASAYSDYRFRGLTLSDGRPVGILDLSYDVRNGLYGALSGTVVATHHDGLQPLGLTLNAGYATRVRPSLTADFGAVHSRYSHYSGVAAGRSYTEFYAGLAGPFVGTRISVSPDYVGTSRWALHGEVNGHIDLTPRLTIDGAAGALVPIGGGYKRSRIEWDGRLGLARRFGAISFHAAITGRVNGHEAYTSRRHRRQALVLGISTAL